MANLEFIIKTRAELEGFESAVRALENQIGKAKALGGDYGQLEQRLKTAQNAIEAYKSSQVAQTEASNAQAIAQKRANEELEKASRIKAEFEKPIGPFTAQQSSMAGLEATRMQQRIDTAKLYGQDTSQLESAQRRLQYIAAQEPGQPGKELNPFAAFAAEAARPKHRKEDIEKLPDWQPIIYPQSDEPKRTNDERERGLGLLTQETQRANEITDAIKESATAQAEVTAELDKQASEDPLSSKYLADLQRDIAAVSEELKQDAINYAATISGSTAEEVEKLRETAKKKIEFEQPKESFTKEQSEFAAGAADRVKKQIDEAKVLGQSTTDLESKLTRLRNIAAQNPAGLGADDMFSVIRKGLADTVPGFAALDSAISKIGAGTLGAVAVGMGTVGSAALGAVEAFNKFRHAQDSVTQLDAALAQTGQLIPAIREQFQGLAVDLRNSTNIDTNRWNSVLTRLVLFGAQSENITRYTDAVKNLAGIMHGNVESAAVAVTRAMQGNFEMFRRYGIVVEDAGTQTEKLEKLFQQLALRGGGQLEAATKTITGQMVGVGNAIGDVLKGVGALIANTGLVQGVLSIAGNAAEFWAEKLKTVIPQVDGLKNATVKTTQSLLSGADAEKEYAKSAEGIKDGANRAKDALSQLNAEIDKQKSSQDRMDDLLKQRDLKRWELLKAQYARAGRPVDEVTDLGVRAGIEKEYERRKTTREVVAGQVQFENFQKAIKDADDVIRQAAELKHEFETRVELAKQIAAKESAILAAEQDLEKALKERGSQIVVPSMPPGPGAPGMVQAQPMSSEEQSRIKKSIEGNEKILQAQREGLTNLLATIPPGLKLEPLEIEQAGLKKAQTNYENTVTSQKPIIEESAKNAKEVKDHIDQVLREHAVANQNVSLDVAAKVAASTNAAVSERLVARIADMITPGAGAEAFDISKTVEAVRKEAGKAGSPLFQPGPQVREIPIVPPEKPVRTVYPTSDEQVLAAQNRPTQALRGPDRTPEIEAAQKRIETTEQRIIVLSEKQVKTEEDLLELETQRAVLGQQLKFLSVLQGSQTVQPAQPAVTRGTAPPIPANQVQQRAEAQHQLVGLEPFPEAAKRIADAVRATLASGQPISNEPKSQEPIKKLDQLAADIRQDRIRTAGLVPGDITEKLRALEVAVRNAITEGRAGIHPSYTPQTTPENALIALSAEFQRLSGSLPHRAQIAPAPPLPSPAAQVLAPQVPAQPAGQPQIVPRAQEQPAPTAVTPTQTPSPVASFAPISQAARQLAEANRSGDTDATRAIESLRQSFDAYGRTVTVAWDAIAARVETIRTDMTTALVELNSRVNNLRTS